MALNLGPSNTFNCSHVKTTAGTNIITKAGTFTLAKGIQTSVGTSILTASGVLNAAQVTGYKVPISFDMLGMTTNLTTYCNFPSGSGNIGTLDSYYQLGTGTAAKAPIPWGGYVIAAGVRCRQPRTAGYVSFTILNGTTSLLTMTFNSTNTKVVNSAILSAGAKTFTANNLRILARTSAAWAPTTANPFAGLVWIVL